VKFGPFEFDRQRRELRKEGRRIRLQEQPFQILETLLESPGEVVSREAIRKRLWPDDTVVEYDHSINAAVRRLRDALRDSAEKSRYVETVARRGYRFIGEWEAIGQPELPAEPAILTEENGLTKNGEQSFGEAIEIGDPARQYAPAHTRTVGTALGLFFLIAAAALFGFRVFGARDRGTRSTGTVSGDGTIRSLAVLPFVNSGGNADTEYLADGITDTLINDLSEISELKVMSRSSVLRYKSPNVDAKTIAESLGVGAVLTGRVTPRGDDLAVSVELVDGHDNSHIWGEHYERKFAAISKIEQDIAREITVKLRLRLSKEETDRLARQHTNNPEAYQAYLKGRYYWSKRGFPSWRPGAAPEFSKSRDYYQQAIEADPGYALAYAGLGHYYAMATGVVDLISPQDGWPKAEAAFRKAMQLDPNLPEAPTGLAVFQWMYRRDWGAAERELQRALQLKANRPDALRGDALYARLLAAEGRFDEAIAQAQGASAGDPLSIRYSSALGVIYYYARRYEESIRQYRASLELNPNDVFVHESLADAFERKGLQREAVNEWLTTQMLYGDSAIAAAVDRAYASGGYRAAAHTLARKKLEQFAGWSNGGVRVPAVEYACAYLRLGDKERALEWLSKACDERTIFVLFLKTDPFWDELRADARFQELLKRIQVPIKS
jgi:TolB-like protein/DNA-binding winged helix-turn-helix (wHTH) protein/Flp pilus assembly protein TadD